MVDLLHHVDSLGPVGVSVVFPDEGHGRVFQEEEYVHSGPHLINSKLLLFCKVAQGKANSEQSYFE